MKKNNIFFNILFIVFLLNIKEKEITNVLQHQYNVTVNKDSIIYNRLNKIDYKKYYGKAVSVLLDNPEVKQYKEVVFIDNKPGYLTSVLLLYSKRVYIRLEVKDYKYIKPFNLKGNWNFEKYKKERLYKATVVYE